MRFGIKDICLVSVCGVLTGCYVMKFFKGILDSVPFMHFLMGAIGIIAALFIIKMVKPLIKQESTD